MTSPSPHADPSRRRTLLWLASGALALLAAPALIAETPPEETAVEAPAPAGLRAYIDPETGDLTSTPSAEQVEALSRTVSKRLEQSLSRSDEGLEPFALPLGGRGVFLEGRFQSTLVVRVAPDGGFELFCVDDPEHAALDPHDHADAAPSPSEWAVK